MLLLQLIHAISAASVWPQPKTVVQFSTTLNISRTIEVKTNQALDNILNAAVDRFQQEYLSLIGGIIMKPGTQMLELSLSFPSQKFLVLNQWRLMNHIR